jgi:hypothetical protein
MGNMVEAVIGLFALFLDWLCLDHVARVRVLYSENNPRVSVGRSP